MNKILLIVLSIALLFCLLGYWTNRQLELENITLKIDDLPDALEKMTILHVSDIHSGRLKVEQEKLLTTMRQSAPDFIFVTGDTIDRTEDVTQSTIQELINHFAEIAPTYIVDGNHEQTSGQYQEWRQLMLSSQAVLIENDCLQLSFNNQPFSLIGLTNKVTDLPDEKKGPLKTSRLTIMLAHHPELIDDYAANFSASRLDLVLAGHAHGGQVRLPLIGGLLSPDQGYLPTYTNGQYPLSKQDTTLIVSRGLGNSSFPFRINNKPHLINITLQKNSY